MPQTSTLTVRLPKEWSNRLEILAKQTSLSRADIAVKAIEQYLDVQDWQIQSIREAVVAADSPDAVFIDHDKVLAHLKKVLSNEGKMAAQSCL